MCTAAHNVDRRRASHTRVRHTGSHCIFQSRVFGPAVFAVLAVSLPSIHMCNTGHHLRHVRSIDGTAGNLPVIVATLGEPLSVSTFFPSREIARRICIKKSQASFGRLTEKIA